jgi:hypothetical protein
MRRKLARLALHRHDLDRWTVVYLVVSAFYPLLRPSVGPDPWEVIVLHTALAFAVWYVPPLLRRSSVKLLRLLGDIYLPFIFPLFYSEMEHLGLVFYDFHASLDPWFIALENTLFGAQPSLVWSQTWPWPWLHELLEFAYFSYYFIFLLTLIMILRCRGIPDQDRWPAMQAFAKDLGATMLICYSL